MSGLSRRVTLRATRLGDNYLYVTYLREYNRSLGPFLSSINDSVRKFNRILMIIMGSYICNIDLTGVSHNRLNSVPLDRASCPIRALLDKRESAKDIQNQQEKRIIPGHKMRHNIKWAPPTTTTTTTTKPTASSTPESSLRKNPRKMAWIAYAVQMLSITAVIVLGLDLVYLYRYHISCLRLKRVRALLEVHGPEKRVAVDVKMHSSNFVSLLLDFRNSSSSDVDVVGNHEIVSNLAELEQTFAADVDEFAKIISYLGDTFKDIGMINEIGYLGTLFVGFCLFVILQQLYLHVDGPAGTHLHRDLIDGAEEQRRIDASCEGEVLKYLESNRVYASVVLSFTQHFRAHDRRQCRTSKLPSACVANFLLYGRPQSTGRPGGVSTNLYREDSHHRPRASSDATSDYHTCRLLMRLLVSGALRPLNRSKRWIALTNLGAALLVSLFPTFYWIVLYGVALMLGLLGCPSNLRLDVTCLLIVVFVNTVAITFHLVALLVACVEQSVLIGRCLNLIHDCLHLNLRLFDNASRCLPDMMTAPTGMNLRGANVRAERNIRDDALSIDKINSNYLLALMTYKIFVSQFALFRQTFRGIFLVVFSVAFVVPILMHIHMPYLQLENEAGAQKVRLISMAASLSFLMVAEAICLPLCYLHAHCQRLYKALASLLAHITEVHEEGAHEKQDKNISKHIYNEHSVAVLRKELSDSRQMLEQFSVESLGVGCTFSTLMEVHFWWGLVAFTILIDTQATYQDSIFGSFVSDPLGVWRFHLI